MDPESIFEGLISFPAINVELKEENGGSEETEEKSEENSENTGEIDDIAENPVDNQETIETPKDDEESGSRKIIARANGIELSIPSNISVNEKQQNRIDKMLSDVAEILFGHQEEESGTGEWFFSARGDVGPQTPADQGKQGPIFNNNFTATLSEDMERKPASGSSESSVVRAVVCFNCEGPHNAYDCPEPKDWNKIRINRLKFQQSSGSGGTPKNRSQQKDAKFDKYVPGQISSALRDALGLRSDQLPPWIYEMRMLGYPPGYYRALTQPQKKFQIYNDASSSGSTSDGEKEVIDPTKVVEYPGFNVPPPSGIREVKNHGYPPMLAEHSKEAFLASLTQIPQFGFRKYEQNRNGKRLREVGGSGSSEMDISDSENVVMADDKADRPVKRQLKFPENDIERLEQERRRLLAELGLEEPPNKRPRLDQSVTSNGESHSDSPAALAIDLASPIQSPSVDFSTDEQLIAPKTIPLTPDGDEEEKSDRSTSTSTQQSQVVSSDPGTPIHKNPHGSMPDLDKFAAGITPYTPKEECMSRGGFKKLKEIMKSHQRP